MAGRRALAVARLTLVAGTTLLAVAGCAVPAQDQPVVVRTVVPGGPAVSHPRSLLPSERVQAYLVRGGRLVAVDRFVPVADGVQPALEALQQPLTPGDSAAGLRSALPTRLDGWTGHLHGAVAEVTVPPGFDRLSVPEQVLALGQLVFTITADTYATGVELVQGGRVVAMPDQDGQLVGAALHRSDFDRLATAPPPASS